MDNFLEISISLIVLSWYTYNVSTAVQEEYCRFLFMVEIGFISLQKYINGDCQPMQKKLVWNRLTQTKPVIDPDTSIIDAWNQQLNSHSQPEADQTVAY